MTLIEIVDKFLEMINNGYDYTYDYTELFVRMRFRVSGIIRLHKPTGQYINIRIDREANNKEYQILLENTEEAKRNIFYRLTDNLRYLHPLG